MSDPYARLNPFNFDNPPDLVSFTSSPAIAEMGSTVDSVVLRWAFNRDVDTLLLNDVSTYSNIAVKTISGPFTAAQTWSIKGSVLGNQTTGKTALSFQNKAYWGSVSALPGSGTDVLAYPGSGFTTTKTKFSIGYNCHGAERPAFAWPQRLGSLTKAKVLIDRPYERAQAAWVDFTDIGVTSLSSLTNPSGFSEAYYVMVFNSLPFEGFIQVRWNY